ncbi:hypothetical protein [Duganella qianjiadongensis]|uniref:Uncharacterized protein n=1 Tax=Duganella qianjiadongensis TaxID=2692176 RepID=A0ABW9VQK9_9BURK|nr:hypothetical protein [Duganella qianjiadongensis]MYM41849.1 hypothetical protein [Duganella qianjiadongensis]
MKRSLLALAILSAVGGQAVASNEISASVLAQSEFHQATRNNPLSLADSHRFFQQGELRWQLDSPWEQTLRGNLSAHHEQDGSSALQVNELAVESPLAGGFLTAGKKIMSWDVGYAFRPLDVVQQEDRRALNPITLQGIPLLAQEAFDEDHALTMVLANPGHGKAAQPRDDEALAARLYRHRGERDEYAVFRLSQRNGLEAGASFSHVLDEGTELHASMLWQQKHDEWRQQRWVEAGRGGKALAGFTWTTERQFSVIGEAWLDRSATAQQQRNVFVRAAQNWDTFDLSADILWQPQSQSKVSTISASWKSGPWLLAASLRQYNGMAGLLTHRLAIASLQRSF